MTDQIEVVAPGGALLGEGPLWDAAAGRLVWLDILRNTVHSFDPVTGTDTVQRYPEPVTALVPTRGGGLLAAMGNRVVRLDTLGTTLATLPTGDRANDGKCDPAGRFLIGTLTDRQEPGACALYRLEGYDRLEVVVSDVTLANGLGWSPSGDRLYFVDTPTRRIDVFDYGEDGCATGRRTFVDLAEADGRPDGLTVDAEGCVWVALIRGAELRRYDARGRLDAVIAMPTSRVTSCAFGGPGLSDLYVTSGCFQMSPGERAAEPLAGALFRLRPDIGGLPASVCNLGS